MKLIFVFIFVSLIAITFKSFVSLPEGVQPLGEKSVIVDAEKKLLKEEMERLFSEAAKDNPEIVLLVDYKNLLKELNANPLRLNDGSIDKLINRFESYLRFETDKQKETFSVSKKALERLSDLKNNNRLQMFEDTNFKINDLNTSGGLTYSTKKSLIKAIPDDFFTSQAPSAYTCTSMTPVDPSETGPALTASDFFTQRTSKVLDIASKLNSAEEIYLYVRDNISFAPYVGATQSAEATIKNETGSAADKASLLISLLRAKGIASEYRYGEVYLDEQFIKDLYEVQGRSDLFWAHYKVTGDYFFKSPTNVNVYQMLKRSNNINYWVMPHIWVRAFIDGNWVDLDPTRPQFKAPKSPVDLYYTAANVSYSDWFFGPDEFGKYVKRETLTDHLIKKTQEKLLADFDGKYDLKDLVGFKQQERIERNSQSLEVGTISSVLPCIESQSTTMKTEYVFKSLVTLSSVGQTNISLERPIAEIAEGELAVTHSQGLYSSSQGGKPGTLYLKLNGEALGSWSINTGKAFKISRAKKLPQRYAPYQTFTNTEDSSNAGSVVVLNLSMHDTSFSTVRENIEIARTAIQNQSSHTVVMTKLLRLAGHYLLYLGDEAHNKTRSLFGLKSRKHDSAITYTFEGVLSNKDDRILGTIPVGTNVSWTILGDDYHKVGDHIYIGDYPKWSSYGHIGIISASMAEHLVWEDLFGIPGASAVKVLQDAKRLDQPYLSNAQFGISTTNDNAIFANLSGPIKDDIKVSVQERLKQKEKPILYSVRDTLSLSSGWAGYGYLLLDESSAAALYRTITFAPIAKGGSTTGKPVASNKAEEGRGLYTADSQVGCSKGNPVNIGTGSMWHPFTDFIIPGRTKNTGISFIRYYLTNGFNISGDLGPGWVHNWETRLVNDKLNNSLDPLKEIDIFWINERGSEFKFTRNQDGSYTPPKGRHETLVKFADRFEIKTKEQVTYIFASVTGAVVPGRVISIIDPHGEEISFEYSNGELSKVSSPLAGEASITRNSEGRITEILRSIDGLSIEFDYIDGKLTESRDLDANPTTYEYVTDMPGTKAQGLLRKITDPIQRSIEFEYFENGLVFKDKDFGGVTREYLYSPFFDRNRTIVKVDNGTSLEYHFDNEFRQIEVVYPDSSRVRNQWDQNDNMTALIDEMGYITEYSYDSKGNRTGVKLPEYSGPVTTTYHPQFNVPTSVTPRVGSTVSFTIDSQTGDVLGQSQNDDQGALTLSFERNEFGGIKKITNNETNYSHVYDGNGLLVLEYDKRNPITYTYDTKNRVQTKSWQNGRIQSFTYDNFDRLKKLEDTHAPTIENTFDEVGRVVERKVGTGLDAQTTTYVYDERDRVIEVIDPLQRVTKTKYDTISLGCKTNDLPRLIEDPAGRKTKFFYNEKSRLVKKIDARGGVTTYKYNIRGEKTEVVDPEGTTTRFVYDGNKRLVKRERDTLRTSGSSVIKGTEVVNFIYDERDKLIRKEVELPLLANGTEKSYLVTELTYDLLGRLNRSVQKKEVFGAIEKVYDDSSFTYKRVLNKDLIVHAENDLIKYDYSFDSTPPFSITNFTTSAVSTSNELNLIEGSFDITPHLTGYIESISRGSSSILSNEYDPAGRLLEVTGSHASSNLISSITYDGFGRKDLVTHSNGLSGDYDYDGLNRVINISWSGPGETFSEGITYNSLTGNIDQIQREFGTFSYSHDEENQLIQSNYSGTLTLPSGAVNRSFEYDFAGNRQGGAVISSRNILRQDQNSVNYPDEYGSGRTIEKKGWYSGIIEQFEYRPDGKIIQFVELLGNGSSLNKDVSYHYDPFNRRIAKLVNSGTTPYTNTYLHLGLEDKILLSKNGSGTETLHLDGQGIDEHFGHIDTAVKTYVTDHLGSVVNNTLTSTAKSYGSFGELLQTAPTAASSQPAVTYGYAGREIELESPCLYYNRWRHYDSCSGRFMSEDPIGLEGGDTNLYRYVGNNSLSAIDPMGLYDLVADQGGAGATFRTAEDAARAVLSQINQFSIDNNVEVGGHVYRQSTGYGFSGPSIGTEDGVSHGTAGRMAGVLSGLYHTHGSATPSHDNENFSPIDRSNSNKAGVPGFLMTPAKAFKSYYPGGVKCP